MQRVYKSLAKCYAKAIEALSRLTGRHYTSINIVGGGSKEGYLNEITSRATGLPIFVGPTEGTGFGIDFNPTCFSHPMVKNGMTLSSPDETIRRFWIDHCKATRCIANEIGEQLEDKVLNNVWIPDGMKDVPADGLGPRIRLKSALDEIFAEPCPNVTDCVEGKVFGIGLESYTVGSHEFYLGYAATHPGIYDLLDNGHFHPTETVSDKISALLCYFDIILLHVTRSVHWDSDHVVLQGPDGKHRNGRADSCHRRLYHQGRLGDDRHVPS